MEESSGMTAERNKNALDNICNSVGSLARIMIIDSKGTETFGGSRVRYSNPVATAPDCIHRGSRQLFGRQQIFLLGVALTPADPFQLLVSSESAHQRFQPD